MSRGSTSAICHLRDKNKENYFAQKLLENSALISYAVLERAQKEKDVTPVLSSVSLDLVLQLVEWFSHLENPFLI